MQTSGLIVRFQFRCDLRRRKWNRPRGDLGDVAETILDGIVGVLDILRDQENKNFSTGYLHVSASTSLDLDLNDPGLSTPELVKLFTVAVECVLRSATSIVIHLEIPNSTDMCVAVIAWSRTARPDTGYLSRWNVLWESEEKRRRKVKSSQNEVTELVRRLASAPRKQIDVALEQVSMPEGHREAFAFSLAQKQEEAQGEARGRKRDLNHHSVLILPPKQFLSWFRDEAATNRQQLRQTFAAWLRRYAGKKLSLDVAKDFDDAVKEGMTRLQVRFECPNCGEPARFSLWTTEGLFQFVHSSDEKHARSKNVPELRLVDAPADKRRRQES